MPRSQGAPPVFLAVINRWLIGCETGAAVMVSWPARHSRARVPVPDPDAVCEACPPVRFAAVGEALDEPLPPAAFPAEPCEAPAAGEEEVVALAGAEAVVDVPVEAEPVAEPGLQATRAREPRARVAAEVRTRWTDMWCFSRWSVRSGPDRVNRPMTKTVRADPSQSLCSTGELGTLERFQTV